MERRRMKRGFQAYLLSCKGRGENQEISYARTRGIGPNFRFFQEESRNDAP
jgi:hypothetical protein